MRARKVGGFSLLDVEVRDEGEVNEANEADADIEMLDNIKGGELRSVVRRLRALGRSNEELPARDEREYYRKEPTRTNDQR